MIDGDDVFEPIPVRNRPMRTEPLEKTLIARMISLYPGDSDEQIVERFLQEQERLGVEEPETWITGEMVARWRPEVTQ